MDSDGISHAAGPGIMPPGHAGSPALIFADLHLGDGTVVSSSLSQQVYDIVMETSFSA